MSNHNVPLPADQRPMRSADAAAKSRFDAMDMLLRHNVDPELAADITEYIVTGDLDSVGEDETDE